MSRVHHYLVLLEDEVSVITPHGWRRLNETEHEDQDKLSRPNTPSAGPSS